ncbi:hypothetical protein DL96DRAFT_176833 [Flagelloscypha sp. PMI_526]|nr:hypothetical protein DL96DRAFT_176833 [Flagelloscypha sp. PMI_526]
MSFLITNFHRTYLPVVLSSRLGGDSANCALRQCSTSEKTRINQRIPAQRNPRRLYTGGFSVIPYNGVVELTSPDRKWVVSKDRIGLPRDPRFDYVGDDDQCMQTTPPAHSPASAIRHSITPKNVSSRPTPSSNYSATYPGRSKTSKKINEVPRRLDYSTFCNPSQYDLSRLQQSATSSLRRRHKSGPPPMEVPSQVDAYDEGLPLKRGNGSPTFVPVSNTGSDDWDFRSVDDSEGLDGMADNNDDNDFDFHITASTPVLPLTIRKKPGLNPLADSRRF